MSVRRDSGPVFSGYERCVHVCAKVAELWRAHRQTEPRELESFGVLLGTTSVDRRDIFVEGVSTPMEHDVQLRRSFVLRDLGHQQIVDQAFSESAGRAIYLGTWHTHPQAVPTPSRIDRLDWRACLRLNRGRPLAFVLVGTVRVRVFVRVGSRFRSLSKVDEDDE